MHLLDTNTCIYAIRKRPPDVLRRLNQLGSDEVALSVIVAMELEVGASRTQNPTVAESVRRWISEFKILPVDDEARPHFARTKAQLLDKGIVIGPMDLLIAAHALALGAILVTNNEREFRRVEGLMIENWT